MSEKIAVLGPIPSGISRIKGKYRWQILIKTNNADDFNQRLINASESIRDNTAFSDVQIQIDKNPINIY